MRKFIMLFKKVGGWEILRQYFRGHVLLFALTQMLLNGFSKKSLEITRAAVTNKILCRLRKKYKKFITDFTATHTLSEHQHSKNVWICWFQGMENAPDLVQRCYASAQEHLKDRNIVLLTENNYRDYIQLPDFIEKKAALGIIPKAHYADLLRLELLIRHGGTWIDSTVLCTSDNIPSYMLDSDLFMFQILKPGLDGQPTCISNWFITACTQHPMLMLTQALLYDYWAHHDKLVDYYIFHDFFQLVIEAYPDLWAQVTPFSSATPHILLLRLTEPFCAQTWEALQAMTPFHKLSYKIDQQADLCGTYYDVLINNHPQ